MYIEKNENQPKYPLTEKQVSMLYSAEHYSAVTNCSYDTFILQEIFMSSSEVKKEQRELHTYTVVIAVVMD